MKEVYNVKNRKRTGELFFPTCKRAVMIKRLFILSTYRRYLIALIIFVLIGISSFLLGEKILAHFFSSVELKEAEKYYRAVGEIVWEESTMHI